MCLVNLKMMVNNARACEQIESSLWGCIKAIHEMFRLDIPNELAADTFAVELLMFSGTLFMSELYVLLYLVLPRPATRRDFLYHLHNLTVPERNIITPGRFHCMAFLV